MSTRAQNDREESSVELHLMFRDTPSSRRFPKTKFAQKLALPPLFAQSLAFANNRALAFVLASTLQYRGRRLNRRCLRGYRVSGCGETLRHIEMQAQPEYPTSGGQW